MAKDTSWLRRELTKALGWDEVVVNGVVDVITTSQTAEDIQDIVEVIFSLLGVACGSMLLPGQCLDPTPAELHEQRPQSNCHHLRVHGGPQ